jgi:hypothetical protein
MQRSQQGLDRPPEPRAGRDGVQINARGDQIRAVQCLAWLCLVPSFARGVLRMSLGGPSALDTLG